MADDRLRRLDAARAQLDCRKADTQAAAVESPPVAVNAAGGAAGFVDHTDIARRSVWMRNAAS